MQLHLITTGEDSSALDTLEEGFRRHCEGRWEILPRRLGMVEHLGLAYDKVAREAGDPNDLLLLCHQDVRPFAVPGHERVAPLPDQYTWLEPALKQPAGWLDTVETLLQHEDTGLMGVAGACGLTPDIAWWQYPDVSGAVVHLAEGRERLNPYGPWGSVAVLDGLCLLIRRSTYQRLPLPSMQQAKFHFYDMDLSLRCLQAGLKNWTIPLLVLHDSGGASTDKAEWRSDHDLFVKTWGSALPVAVPFEPLSGDR